MDQRWLCAALLGWTLLGPAPAEAAAGRTFVATTGVDTNTASNCGATTPCRTFAAALSVTGSGGEIVVLSSGGYGPFTLTQSVSITAPDGVYAGISVASGVGITIATPGVSVALKGLTINGTGGNVGIYMTAGSALTLIDCVIDDFAAIQDTGIYVTGVTQLRILNSIVRDNNVGIALDNGVIATIDGTQVLGNTGGGISVHNSGVNSGAQTVAYLHNDVLNSNAIGVVASGVTSTSTAQVYATGVVASGSSYSGFQASAWGTLVAAGCSAMDNAQYGFFNSGGTFLSAGTNVLSGNVLAPTSGTITSGGLLY